MQKELITMKTGHKLYSFVYYNSADQKRIRLSRDYIRARFGKDITDPEEADQILHLLGKELQCLATEKAKRLSLSKEESGFSGMLEMYTQAQKKAAPNSYANNVHYFKFYVLCYFLNIKACKDLEEWHFHYEDFKEWLEQEAYLLKKPDQLISYASKNHAIRALNTFMRHMQRKHFIFTLRLCPQFPEYKLKEKSIDDIVSLKEMTALCKGLKQKNQDRLSVFYRLLFYTGLRFNEGRGISLENIFEGEVEDATFNKRLADHKISYYGYILINSQPFSRQRLREANGHVKRKPLKSRRRIDERSSRVIPLTDKVLWQELAAIYNQLIIEYDKRLYGDDLGNYLFFDGTGSTSNIHLRRVSSDLGIAYRSWHSLRHTRATYLVGETGDFMLARLWLGHKKQEVLEKYVHVYQSIARNAKKKKSDKLKAIDF